MFSLYIIFLLATELRYVCRQMHGYPLHGELVGIVMCEKLYLPQSVCFPTETETLQQNMYIRITEKKT